MVGDVLLFSTIILILFFLLVAFISLYIGKKLGFPEWIAPPLVIAYLLLGFSLVLGIYFKSIGR